ncbi:MAG: hypothetical protein IJ206_09375 [Oscillospiraceae bacterium]|nr:hypothetical protein [Oscillospiraceae bacterium]
MQFTRNWGNYDPIEKGSPGSAEALTGDNRKKNIFNIPDVPGKVKPKGTIYGATVYYQGNNGEIMAGTVTGESCPCIELERHLYKVKPLLGDTEWIPGQDLYLTKAEAVRAGERRARWTKK